MDFKQVDEKFRQLKARYEAGELTEAEFKAQLLENMVQDEQGNWWVIGYETERWYRHDGTDWVQADPPVGISPQKKPVQPSVQEPPKERPKPVEHPVAAPAAQRQPRKWLLPAGILTGTCICLAAATLFMIPNIDFNSATSTPPPPATEAPRGQPVLFFDDFSDPNSGWPHSSNGQSKSDYSGDGRYVIQVNVPNIGDIENPGQLYSDVSVEVDATKTGGPDPYGIALICRYQDINNFYYFYLSYDGYQGIGRYQRGLVNLLSSDKLQLTNAILPGNATNHMRGVCNGSTLTFIINGQQVSSATDTTFTSGDVGLAAWSYTEPNVEVSFDNFEVTQP